MKNLKLMLVLVFAMLSNVMHSQDQVVTKESLPIDAKTNCSIRYYYFPNLEAYFDNLELVYYFKVNGEWQTAEELPANYGGYSIYNKLRVTITDYDGDEPYNLVKKHKKMFPYNAKGRFTNQTASNE